MTPTTRDTTLYRCWDPDRGQTSEDAMAVEERSPAAAAEEFVSRRFSSSYWENAGAPVTVFVYDGKDAAQLFEVEIRSRPEFHATRKRGTK